MPDVRRKNTKRFIPKGSHVREFIPKPNLILSAEIFEAVDKDRELSTADLDVKLTEDIPHIHLKFFQPSMTSNGTMMPK
jgi:hypothetical protein